MEGGLGIYVRILHGGLPVIDKVGAHNVVMVGRVRESTSMCQRMGLTDSSYAGLTGQEKVEG